MQLNRVGSSHKNITWMSKIPFSLYYRKWQPVWSWECRINHTMYQTSILLAQQPQKIAWYPVKWQTQVSTLNKNLKRRKIHGPKMHHWCKVRKKRCCWTKKIRICIVQWIWSPYTRLVCEDPIEPEYRENTEVGKWWFVHLQSQLITFNQNSNRVSHEFICHLQNFVRQSCRYQYNLQ